MGNVEVPLEKDQVLNSTEMVESLKLEAGEAGPGLDGTDQCGNSEALSPELCDTHSSTLFPLITYR